jgi:hypothetical protein
MTGLLVLIPFLLFHRPKVLPKVGDFVVVCGEIKG